MSTVGNVANTNNVGNTNGSSGAVATENAQDRFLKLLVTQLQNQDPLNPLDNAQVTSQIAQISTVQGIENLNASMKSMSESVIAAQSLQATTMIGRGVLAEGDGLMLASGQALGGFDLALSADRATVKIFDAAGNLVDSQQLGKLDAGRNTFEWDGTSNGGGNKLADGRYRFEIEAFYADKPVEATPLTFATVQSVSLDGGVKLNTDALGTIDVGIVKQII